MSAKDLGTGKEQKITIESQTSLSEDEIKAKIAEAEEFAEEDRKEESEGGVEESGRKHCLSDKEDDRRCR